MPKGSRSRSRSRKSKSKRSRRSRSRSRRSRSRRSASRKVSRRSRSRRSRRSRSRRSRSRRSRSRRSRSRRSRSRSRKSRSAVVFHSRYRSRSAFGVHRPKGCRGGSPLKKLRRQAKMCGLTNYSKLKKCALVRKLGLAKSCSTGIAFLHSGSAKKYKKRGSRSRSRGRRLGHTWRGKQVILSN